MWINRPCSCSQATKKANPVLAIITTSGLARRLLLSALCLSVFFFTLVGAGKRWRHTGLTESQGEMVLVTSQRDDWARCTLVDMQG